MKLAKRIAESIDFFIFAAIGIISLGYIIWGSSFAEMHVRISFLNFPVFVGEIFLGICLAPLLAKEVIRGRKLRKWHYLLIMYMAFVLAKAIYGYISWGPLAFRHAALFYYPFYALLGYVAFRRRFLCGINAFIINFIILALLLFRAYITYWTLALFLLSLILAYSFPHRIIKVVLIAILLVITPYQYLFYTSRMMIVGNFIAVLLMIIAFSFFIKISARPRLICTLTALCLLTAGVYHVSKNSVKSIIDVKELKHLYSQYDRTLEEKRGQYNIPELAHVKVYNPNKNDIFINIVTLFEKKEKTADLPSPEPGVAPDSEKGVVMIEEPVEKKSRSIGHQMRTALFRIFIWRDMLEELTNQKPLFGFDFGKPLRSISLEILNWGTGEWSRDGWIAAHNSYLHIIYRSGLVGIVLVLGFILYLFRLIINVIALKSVPGVLLCAILLSWFVAANFLLILELPYTAVPLWSLFGMTVAYRDHIWAENHH